MRVRDTCPSCGSAVSPDDLLCANCELILDVNQLPDRPNETAEFSVVRRMLEVPQRGVPTERPSGPMEAVSLGADGGDGPTRVFALGRNTGVPVVVASLTKKALSLSELEAFVVSFIDGERDVKALALKTRIGELEMGVVLQTLNDKMVIDFADDQPAPTASITADEETPEPAEPATVMMKRLPTPPPRSGPREAPTMRLEPIRLPIPEPAPTPPPEAPLPPPVAHSRAAPSQRKRPAPTPPPAAARPTPPAPPTPPPRIAPAVLQSPPPPPVVEASVIIAPVASVVVSDSLLPLPPTTPPEVPDLELAPAPIPSRPRRTLPSGSRITGSRAAPPLKLDSEKGSPTPPNGASPSGLRAPETAKVVVSTPPVGSAPSGLRSPAPAKSAPTPPSGSSPSGLRAPEAARVIVASAPAPAASGVTAEPADEPRESTDPRIINRGRVNQKVLDALKQVKRRDAPAGDAPARVDDAAAENIADKLAAGSLQVAIRMEQNGRLDEAIRFLENSISKSPDAPSLYNRLAIILMRERGDLRRAEQMLQKAVELAPENEVYEKNLKAVLSKRAMAKK